MKVLLWLCVVSAALITTNEEVREVEYIDDEGRAGILKGTFIDKEVQVMEFVTETETGRYLETYTYEARLLKHVVVEETTYNRPKFWNEALARANGDNEWFDPEKSVTTLLTYYYEDGELQFWENEKGQKSYPVNRRLRKKGEKYLDKAKDYLAALNS